MVKIKICGISEAEHASTSAAAGADILGLVFAESRRRVTLEKAREIVDAAHGLTPHPKIAGVFVNSPAVDVNHIASVCHLDFVQLSGDENREYCQEINCNIIKVLHVMSNIDVEYISSEIREFNQLQSLQNTIFMLDTKNANSFGGTGKAFDWKLVTRLSANRNIMVAGGLDSSNVTRLLELCTPWGVDVSSGVETQGKKDMQRVKSFIETVRNCEKREEGGSGVS
jgi:phosphoribosylanthranilate isomerase